MQMLIDFRWLKTPDPDGGFATAELQYRTRNPTGVPSWSDWITVRTEVPGEDFQEGQG